MAAEADELCSAIAEKQYGLIERQQALQAGVSPAGVSRRLASRRWLRVLPGVYRFAGAPTSWEQSLKAATLWGGDRCVVSHETAAALHGLTLFSGSRVHVQSPKLLQRPKHCGTSHAFLGLAPGASKGDSCDERDPYAPRLVGIASEEIPRESSGPGNSPTHDRRCPAQGRAPPLRRQSARHEGFAPTD